MTPITDVWQFAQEYGWWVLGVLAWPLMLAVLAWRDSR